jgi:hypothetical protein
MTDTTTTPPPRQAGLRGLLPINQELHAALKTPADYGFALPSPTYPIDRTAGITDWGMGGNGPDPTLTANGGQPAGDCGPCAVPYHADEMARKLWQITDSTTEWTSDKVMELYLRYNNGQDNGVDLGSWLLWLFQQGYIEGFVKLDLDQMDAALETFYAVVAGVNLNPQADRQFENHQPWSVGYGDEPDPNRGHAILYLNAQSATGPYKWCTWGGVQASTYGWRHVCVTQAFAVLTKEAAEAMGFPFAEAVADLRALGGTVAEAPPAPQPAPAPATPPQPASPPPPGPAPAPAPQPAAPADSLIAEIESMAHTAIDHIVALVRRMGGHMPEWNPSEEPAPPESEPQP